MPKQINSFILPDDIIKDMKNKIKSTKKLKVELGFALCINKDTVPSLSTISKPISSTISKGSECTGTHCSIKTGTCNIDQRQIGTFHTHPMSAATMSITDMVTGCTDPIQCIGSSKFNNIICYIRKSEESSCLKDTSPLENKEHEILEEGFKLRYTMSNPKIILKEGIYKTLKAFKQYDDTVFKYNADRIKLLKRHFDRINV